MKRLSIILIALLFLTGCSGNLYEADLNKAIYEVAEIISSEDIRSNAYGTGFKYYKPRDFAILEAKEFNHTLLHNSNKYYLNVDINAY